MSWNTSSFPLPGSTNFVVTTFTSRIFPWGAKNSPQRFWAYIPQPQHKKNLSPYSFSKSFIFESHWPSLARHLSLNQFWELGRFIPWLARPWSRGSQDGASPTQTNRFKGKGGCFPFVNPGSFYKKKGDWRLTRKVIASYTNGNKKTFFQVLV